MITARAEVGIGAQLAREKRYQVLEPGVVADQGHRFETLRQVPHDMEELMA